MNQLHLKLTDRVLCRFSCGAASAVATKLAIAKYGDRVAIYYSDTGSEHPDNQRFLADCERWFGRQVNVLKNPAFQDIWDLFEKTGFIVNQYGARCTGELKRKVGEAIWMPGDIEVFGYTAEETKRLAIWRENNPERIIECPLIDSNLSKEDCFAMIERAGIDLPVMYKLGFRNNNCIGCVKARGAITYWKRVRQHFPEVFARMAGVERKLGQYVNTRRINGKRVPIYLDEIGPGDPQGKDPKISCGLFCMAAEDVIEEAEDSPCDDDTSRAVDAGLGSRLEGDDLPGGANRAVDAGLGSRLEGDDLPGGDLRPGEKL